MFTLLVILILVFSPLLALLTFGPGEMELVTLPKTHYGIDAELRTEVSQEDFAVSVTRLLAQEYLQSTN